MAILFSETVTLIFDLDFVTTEKVFIPKNIDVKYESSITYRSKARGDVSLCRQTDRPTGQKLDNPRSIDAGA